MRQLVSESSVWRHLAWRDLRSRYAQTRIGPWWSVLSLALSSTGVSVALSVLNSRSLLTNLEFVSVGLAIWTMMIAIVVESAGMFEADRSVLLNSTLSPMTSVYRNLWRNYLLFLHNCVFVGAISVFSESPAALVRVLLLPFVGLICGAMMLMPSSLFGYLSLIWPTGKSVIPSLTSLLFFVTPVMWDPPNSGVGRVIALCNPLNWPISLARGMVTDGEVSLSMFLLSLSAVFIGGMFLLLASGAIRSIKKRL